MTSLTKKVLVGGALVAGVVILARRAQRPACRDSAECPGTTICWNGRCIERGRGAVDYVDRAGGALDNAVDTLRSIFDGWVSSDAVDKLKNIFGGWGVTAPADNDGPITSTTQV